VRCDLLISVFDQFSVTSTLRGRGRLPGLEEMKEVYWCSLVDFPLLYLTAVVSALYSLLKRKLSFTGTLKFRDISHFSWSWNYFNRESREESA
jgi:hypothetical protein